MDPYSNSFLRVIMPAPIHAQTHSVPFYLRAFNLAAPAAIIGGVFFGPLGIVIGILAGASLGIVYSFFAEIWQRNYPPAGLRPDSLAGSLPQQQKDQRFPRILLRPSRSRVYTFDVAVFFGANTLAMLGFVIGLLVGGPFGAAIGAGVGALLGTVLGLVHAYYVKRWEIKYLKRPMNGSQILLPDDALLEDDLANQLEEKNGVESLQPMDNPTLGAPSIYDIPWYLRGFVGVHFGGKFGPKDSNVTSGNLFDFQPESSQGVELHEEHILGPYGVVIGFFVALIEPYLANLWYKLAKRLGMVSDRDSYVNDEKGAPRWIQESRMDVPLVPRLLFGAIIGAFIGSVLFPVLGTWGGIIVGCALTAISPYVFGAGRNMPNDRVEFIGDSIRNILKGFGLGLALFAALFFSAYLSGVAIPVMVCLWVGMGAVVVRGILPSLNPVVKKLATMILPDDNETKKGLSMDLPWAMRVVIAIILASLLSMSFTVLFGFGHLVALTLAITAYTVAQPVINAFIMRIPGIKDVLIAVSPDTVLPSYKRMIFGALLGGVLGISMQYLLGGGMLLVLALGSPIPIVPALVLGMALGIMIGSVVTLVYPYVKALILGELTKADRYPISSWGENEMLPELEPLEEGPILAAGDPQKGLHSDAVHDVQTQLDGSQVPESGDIPGILIDKVEGAQASVDTLAPDLSSAKMSFTPVILPQEPKPCESLAPPPSTPVETPSEQLAQALQRQVVLMASVASVAVLELQTLATAATVAATATQLIASRGLGGFCKPHHEFNKIPSAAFGSDEFEVSYANPETIQLNGNEEIYRPPSISVR